MKKVTLAQVFSCEFCGVSKNTFLQNTSRRLLLNLVDMLAEKLFFIPLNVKKYILIPFFDRYLFVAKKFSASEEG